MIFNYIKTAFRNIIGNKFYTLINIAGLTTGLVVGLFILLWVQDELSYDTFNSKSANIYRIHIDGGSGGTKRIFSYIIAPAATYAKNEIPEVKDAVRIFNVGGNVPFKYKDKTFLENHVAFADPSVFSVFDFPLINGNPSRPFDDDASLVISRSVAERYFGKENPIGKAVLMGHDELFHISGVVNNMPANSTEQYDVFIPLQRFNRLKYQDNVTSYNGTNRVASMDADWVNFSFDTYLLVKSGTDIHALEKKLQKIHERNKPDDAPVPYIAQPLAKLHLYTADGGNNGIETVRIFAIVALLILLIACINYVNLSTARAMLRAKEVSVRKMIGAARWQLFMQFIAETALLFIISAILAVGLMFLLLPVYNNFAGKHLQLNLYNSRIWYSIGIALLGTLAAASIYPALLLSSFKPLLAMKGKLVAGIGNVSFRRVLVVMQFSISVMLIVSTLVIGRQLNFIQHKSLGYDKENVLTFNMRYTMQPHYAQIRSELEKQPGVLAVTRSAGSLVDFQGWTGDTDWEGKTDKNTLFFHPILADQTTIPFFSIKIKEGENFNGLPADSAHFIVNETAVKAMGLQEPLGKRLRIGKTTGVITGVTADFHFTSMRTKIEPAVFVYNPADAWSIYIKTTGMGAQNAVKASLAIWKQYNGDVPLSYTFMDDSFNKLYQSEQRVAGLSALFAAVAVILSCLGLLGLATYTAQVRTREIGIRKVLGASSSGILRLLAREFMLLVFISLCVALPVAWFSMRGWLADYAYRVNLGWQVFVMAGVSALFIAFVTVSFQSLKAAWANPIKSLRQE